MHELFDKANDSLETRLVSDALINIYAAHVHSLLYPYNHPLVSDSLKNAFHGLRKAFRKKPQSQIRIETSEGKLMIDGKVLDDNVFVLGHFSSWLVSMNIKALSFARELTQRELIRFHKIISTKKLSVDEISKAITEKSIANIIVHPAESLAAYTGIPSPDYTSHNRLIKDYESTMFHIESGKAQSPFFMRSAKAVPHEEAANYGLSDDHERKMYQQESSEDLSSLSIDSHKEEGSFQEIAEGNLRAECVEALLEYNIPEDKLSIIMDI